MNKTLKKMIVLFSVVSLLLTTVACGNAKTSSGAVTSTENTGTKGDLKGRTVSLSAYNDITPKKSSPTYAQELALWKQIEKDYNCKLECVNYTNFNAYHKNLLLSAMSNEQIGDVFYASAERIVPRWTNADLLVPIGDYVDINNDVWNADASKDYLINGKGYCAIAEGYGLGWVILFNKRICAEKGIKDTELYQLQENGQWTWDKLRQYAIATTGIDSDGASSIYGIVSASGSPIATEPFIYTNGTEPVIVNEDKSYTFNLDSQACLEAMNFCYDLAYKDKVTNGGYGQGSKIWEAGKAAFCIFPGWSLSKEMYDKLKDDEYGILLMPKGPRAKDYVNTSAALSGWFMQESTKDKEIIGKILSDWVAGKKEIDNANNSQELISVALSDFLFDDGSAKTVDMIKGRTTVLKGGAATWFCENVLWGGWGIVEKMPPSTYVASIKNESIKSFNDMFSTDVDK